MPILSETVATPAVEESLGAVSGNQEPSFSNVDSGTELLADSHQQLPHPLDIAVQFVKSELKPERIFIESVSDPEGDIEWTVLRADVRASVDEVLRRYNACKSLWLRVTLPSEQNLVRFVYNIL